MNTTPPATPLSSVAVTNNSTQSTTGRLLSDYRRLKQRLHQHILELENDLARTKAALVGEDLPLAAIEPPPNLPRGGKRHLYKSLTPAAGHLKREPKLKCEPVSGLQQAELDLFDRASLMVLDSLDTTRFRRGGKLSSLRNTLNGGKA